jgi:hypothetical protein
MRRSAQVVVTVFALLWGGTAFAIVSDTTVTSGGTPIGGTTISLTIKQPQKPKIHETTHTSKTGRTKITLPDNPPPGTTVDITITVGGGKTYTAYNVPFDTVQRLIQQGISTDDLIFVNGGGGIPFTDMGIPTGLELEISLINTWACETKDEYTLAGTLSSTYRNCHDPLGGGAALDYYFPRWNNWAVGVFGSWDANHVTVNQAFAGGFYFGSTEKWVANLGGKLAYWVEPNWRVYGLAGAAWVNESLNFAFAPGYSSKTVTTPGFTAGFGTEYHPQGWDISGHPIGLVGQYQHTWYATAWYNQPTPASPAFNYAFRRGDDILQFGVTIH